MSTVIERGITKKINTGALSIRVDPVTSQDPSNIKVDYMNFYDDVDWLLTSVSQKLKNGEEVRVTLETDKGVEKHKVVLSDVT